MNNARCRAVVSQASLVVDGRLLFDTRLLTVDSLIDTPANALSVTEKL